MKIDTNTWHKVDAKGTLPAPMYLHSGVVYDNCLYTFGGKLTHEGNDCINKIYKFHFGKYFVLLRSTLNIILVCIDWLCNCINCFIFYFKLFL